MHASYSQAITQRARLPPARNDNARISAHIMHNLHSRALLFRSTADTGTSTRPTLPPSACRYLNRHGSPCLALLCQLSIKLTQRCSKLLSVPCLNFRSLALWLFLYRHLYISFLCYRFLRSHHASPLPVIRALYFYIASYSTRLILFSVYILEQQKCINRKVFKKKTFKEKRKLFIVGNVLQKKCAPITTCAIIAQSVAQ